MKILRLIDGVQAYDANDYTATSYHYSQNGYSAPFATGYPYQIFYSVGLDFDSLNLEISPFYIPEDYPIHLTFNYTEPREEYEVFRNTFMQTAANITNTTTLWSVYSKTGNYKFGDFYNDVENKSLYLAVTGNSVGQPSIYDQNDASIAKIKAYRCRWNCPAPIQDDGLPTVERKWSEAKGWSEGVVPQDGDSIIIEEHETVILDVDTASLNTLEIRGTLIFSDQVSSLTLTAKIIWVRGHLIAGTEETPYENKAIIKLTGTIVDEPIVVNFAVDVSTKVLVVTGTLSLVGQQVNSLVRLGASVNPGDKQLQIVGDITSFKKGDQIVLAPSGSNPSEHESFLINEIDLVQ